MIEVEFLGPLSAQGVMSFDENVVKNLGDLSEKLNEQAQLQKWLKICAVAVNDEMVSDKNFALKSGDRVLILPPVCGG